MSKTIEGAGVVAYEDFCRDDKGKWLSERQYQWHYEHLNAEYKGGHYGQYAREVVKGEYENLITSLLYECGIRSEGVMTPLLTKSIFTEPQDRIDVHDLIEHIISEERFQELLDKYTAIKNEFLERHEANQKAIKVKHSKPKQHVKSFRAG